MRRAAALIVGGGPAGSAAAIALARRDVATLLIERDAAPRDALCGGFLSWRTLATLERLGVDVATLGARPIGRVRILAGARAIEAALPGRAVGLSRLALDAALLAEAAKAGATIERGVAARTVEGGQVRLDDDRLLAPQALFLATGKHELRGLARPKDAAGDDPALGLRFRLAPTPALMRALDGMIELHLFDRGYAGLLLQEDGSANLCMAVHRSRLAAAGGRPEALLAALAAEAPGLAARIGAAAAIGPAQAVAQVPYGWRARRGAAGLFRLGDQAAVIPSLAGEGVGIALASGMLAAENFATRGASGGDRYQRRLAARLRLPFAVAGALRRSAERPGAAGPLLAIGRSAPWLLDPLARLTRIG